MWFRIFSLTTDLLTGLGDGRVKAYPMCGAT